MKQLYLLISILIISISYAQDAKLTVSVPDGTNAVRLTGPFWGWDPAGGPEAVDNGNGTWTVTLSPAPTAQMEYKWVLDGTQEDLVAAAADGGCTDRAGDSDAAGPHMITNYSSYANRIWKVGDGDIVNDVAGSCGTFLNTSNGFDNVASTIGWTGIADATSSDATLEFDGTNGNTGGAMKLTGTNPGTAGKAYIFEYTDSDFNYTNASDVKIQFDAKFDGTYNGAVHMQTQMPGSGTLNSFDIQNDGINENTWTAIEYDFENVQPTGTNDIFRIHFNLAAASVVGGGGSLLIDNLVITLSGDGTPEPDPAPTDAPTAPTEDAADVISIFSDAYTDIAATFNPSWGQNTLVSNETFAGNAVKKYKSFNYSGIVPDATIDVNSHSSIKLDYWTADATTIKVKFRDYGANDTYDANVNGAPGGDDIEHEITHTVSTTSAWQTLQINLAEFNTLTAKNIGQIILSASTSGGGNSLVYFDNIYFSKETSNGGGDSGGGDTGGGDVIFDFEDASQINSFTKIADAATRTDEVVSEHVTTGGNPNGAYKFGGTNSDGAGGRNYSFVYEDAAFDYSTAATARITFDLLQASTGLPGTAIHFRYETPGGGPQFVGAIQSNGLNGSTWTSYQYDATVSGSSTGIFKITYEFAAGATQGDGGEVLLDNVAVTLLDSSGNVLSIQDLSDNTFMIYPNPVQNTLNVSAGATVDSVSIFDLTGRQVLRATPNAAAFSLDVANLNKGLYLVSLKAGDQEMTTKLVK